MPMAIAYWILMLLWLVLYLVYLWPHGAIFVTGAAIIQFLLFLIIGWKLFGRPLQ